MTSRAISAPSSRGAQEMRHERAELRTKYVGFARPAFCIDLVFDGFVIGD